MTALQFLKYISIVIAIVLLPYLIFSLPISLQYILFAIVLHKATRQNTATTRSRGVIALLAFAVLLGVLNIYLAYKNDQGWNDFTLGDPVSGGMMVLYSAIIAPLIGTILVSRALLRR